MTIRVYSNSCRSCSFEPEIIKIGQSFHKMYRNNIVNFQESMTILNAYTKKVWKLIQCTMYIYINIYIYKYTPTCTHMHTHTHTHTHIYIYMYIYPERKKERKWEILELTFVYICKVEFTSSSGWYQHVCSQGSCKKCLKDKKKDENEKRKLK